MAVKLAETIAGAVKEGLSLWKTYIATRQEAYNRKQDKRQEKAIHTAEQMIEKIHLFFNFIFENIELPEDKKAEYERLKLLIYRKITQFNKYD